MRILVTVLLAAFASSAFASPKCTTEPKEKWISKADMRAKAEAAGHKIEVLKVTKGGCYEVYGRDAAGKRIEIYFNPLTGDAVEHS
jgi:hypothetical protein